jgi:hypothetical protein
MNDKKIVVPLDMAMAAAKAVYDQCNRVDYHPQIRIALEAALRWLAENPIVPTDMQCEAMYTSSLNDRRGSTGYVREFSVEWQRRMFLAPEPEVPEAVKDLLYAPNGTPDGLSEHVIGIHDARVIEAYRRGKQSK